MPVHRWNAALDGEFTEAALRGKLEAQGYRVARYVYSPGTVFPDHKHGVDKVDLHTMDASLALPHNNDFAFIGSQSFTAEGPGQSGERVRDNGVRF